jgi:hypothetical protein
MNADGTGRRKVPERKFGADFVFTVHWVKRPH